MIWKSYWIYTAEKSCRGSNLSKKKESEMALVILDNFLFQGIVSNQDKIVIAVFRIRFTFSLDF